jgi:hypothetical protein
LDFHPVKAVDPDQLARLLRPVQMLSRESRHEIEAERYTTRSRVNFFLNKFKKLGSIEYNGEIPLKINSSLLSVVLHD